MHSSPLQSWANQLLNLLANHITYNKWISSSFSKKHKGQTKTKLCLPSIIPRFYSWILLGFRLRTSLHLKACTQFSILVFRTLSNPLNLSSSKFNSLLHNNGRTYGTLFYRWHEFDKDNIFGWSFDDDNLFMMTTYLSSQA